MAPPKLSNACTFLIELLAAVPSVIYGLLGIFVLVPFLQRHVVPSLKSVFGSLPIFSGAFYGYSLFSAGIVLSIMIVPFIVSVSREVLLSVPRDQREASLALGASHWQTTWRVVVPNASTGIIGSIFLALARALGETMAVTMVIGNVPQIKASLLAPGYSIAAVIANEFTEATGDLYLSALIELGLVLFGVTFLLNGLARILIILTGRKGAHA
jgi:phosphate transport system permease protein